MEQGEESDSKKINNKYKLFYLNACQKGVQALVVSEILHLDYMLEMQ